MSLHSRFCRSIFLRLCERIQVGSLDVTTPDGQVHSFEGGRAPEIRAQMEIADESFFARVLGQGDWGLGFAYVDRLWDTKDPAQIARLLMLNEASFRPVVRLGQWLSPSMRQIHSLDRENQGLAEHVRRRTVSECYDVGNDFFRWMLGPSMVFTCAIWPDPDATLEEAQRHKLDVVTRKARIEAGHRVVDLGCGWGTLAAHIQETTGATVKGIALSKRQIEWAREHHPACEFEYLNYSHLEGTYDRIVSVGLAEHVGRPHMQALLEQVSRHLVPGGRFVMHTMTSHDGLLMRSRNQRWTSFGSVVMPNGDVPSLTDIVRACMATGTLRILHTESYGIHYTRTSEEWVANLHRNRDAIVDAYSERVFRTYEYAIAMGGAAMETGMSLSHIVFENRPYGSDLSQSMP